mmetsp:Transcript_27267/g.35045  ORF Transcript_27267/g.35045 Transcript_27267/m.35045 type:complete len:201 (+) Transcript_27267:1081-1683(+)
MSRGCMSISLGDLTMTSYFGAFKPFFDGAFLFTSPVAETVAVCFPCFSDASPLDVFCLVAVLEVSPTGLAFFSTRFFPNPFGSFSKRSDPAVLLFTEGSALLSILLVACAAFSFCSILLFLFCGETFSAATFLLTFVVGSGRLAASFLTFTCVPSTRPPGSLALRCSAFIRLSSAFLSSSACAARSARDIRLAEAAAADF